MFYREGRVYSVDTVQITDGLITAYRRVVVKSTTPWPPQCRSPG
jgi:hypothetical protein